jgi:hypothetical protein
MDGSIELSAEQRKVLLRACRSGITMPVGTLITTVFPNGDVKAIYD